MLTRMNQLRKQFSPDRMRRALRDASGAIDLASTMVGVIVIGVVGGIIAASVITAIPWSQDESSKAALSTVAIAESSHTSINGVAVAYDSHDDSDYRAFEMGDPGISPNGQRLIVDVSDDGKSWVAVARSESGKIFIRSSLSAEIFEAESEGYVLASGAGAPTAGMQSFAIPAALRIPDGFDSGAVQAMVTAVALDIPYVFGALKAGYSGPPDTVVEPEAAAARMVSVWDTTLDSGSAKVRLPLHGAMSATVDWGDGVVEAATAGATHTYATHGIKTVTIDGTFEGYGTLSAWGYYPDRLVKVTEWGPTGTTDLSYAFLRAHNLTEIADIPITATTLRSMFYDADFNSPVNFDTPNVTSMALMFHGNETFNQPVNFDTSKVTDMERMFYDNYAFNQPVNFDTSNVTNMQEMFATAHSFAYPVNFDTSKVTTMENMFHAARSFNQPVNFDTSNVTTMKGMFREAHSFNQPVTFDTGKVTNMSGMFASAIVLNQPVTFTDTSKVTTMYWMFLGATVFNQDLRAWDVSAVTNHTAFESSSALTAGNIPIWLN